MFVLVFGEVCDIDWSIVDSLEIFSALVSHGVKRSDDVDRVTVGDRETRNTQHRHQERHENYAADDVCARTVPDHALLFEFFLRGFFNIRLSSWRHYVIIFLLNL